jgi:hypothetical protein
MRPMRFLYKIYSRYDGFRPPKIPERRDENGRMILGWRHYIDVLERGAEVWVFFHGHSTYQPGVYAKGFVHEIDADAERVYLRIREWAADKPLIDAQTNSLVADAVAQRGRQVFYLPETLLPTPTCNVQSCGARQCDSCPRWKRLPVISKGEYRWPQRLPDSLGEFIPAYWVIPSRCFLFRTGEPIAEGVRQSSDLFYRFKAGEGALAYPLARGVYEALRRQNRLDFDAVIPIPLSPDKNGELNRTLSLAHELSRLLGVPVLEGLKLGVAISKRRLRNAGWSASQFEQHYSALLEVHPRVADLQHIILIDDVCDHGSTLKCASLRLQAVNPALEITAVSAGQMVIKEAVRTRDRLVA